MSLGQFVRRLRVMATQLLFLSSLASSASVRWTSPQAGDVLGPGDHLFANWTSSDEPTTPTFKICVQPSADDAQAAAASGTGANCGDAVTPTIKPGSTVSSFYTQIYLPNVTTQGVYFLQMEEDGNLFNSPSVTLTSGAVNATVSALANKTASATSSSSASTSGAVPSSMLPPPLPPSQPADDDRPQSSPLSTAAVVVPVTALGLMALLAAVLCLSRRRPAAAFQGASVVAQPPAGAGRPVSTAARLTDIEKAVLALVNKDARTQGSVSQYPPPALWNQFPQATPKQEYDYAATYQPTARLPGAIPPQYSKSSFDKLVERLPTPGGLREDYAACRDDDGSTTYFVLSDYLDSATGPHSRAQSVRMLKTNSGEVLADGNKQGAEKPLPERPMDVYAAIERAVGR